MLTLKVSHVLCTVISDICMVPLHAHTYLDVDCRNETHRMASLWWVSHPCTLWASYGYQWRIYVLVKGGGVLGKGLGVPKTRSARGVRGIPPLGNVWNIGAFSCILGHLLTNFRDSEKEFSAHTSVFHWNYSSALCWGMVGGIPSRKIDKFMCSLLDYRAFSGLNSNKFRSFLRNQLLLVPTFTNIMTNNGNMLKNY